MLLIYKNTFSDVILTLSEKTTLENAVYLFEFINDETKNSFCFLSSDLSGNKERYNKFRIVDSATVLPLVGQLNFETGRYKYNVYEQSSTTNLDPTLALNLVDIGKAEVIENEVARVEFTATQENYKVYGG